MSNNEESYEDEILKELEKVKKKKSHTTSIGGL